MAASVPKRDRFCLIAATKFASSNNKEEQPWLDQYKLIQNASYDKVFLPIESIKDDPDKISDEIHKVLDSLPQYGPHEYLLDVLWLTEHIPNSKKLPPVLFGAFKRAVEWHGAALGVMCSNKGHQRPTSYIKELHGDIITGSLAEYLDKNLRWRGTLVVVNRCSGRQAMGASV